MIQLKYWYCALSCPPLGIEVQGAPKKMQHSDLYLISVLEAGLYFFTCVLESEFLARFI